MAKLRTWLKSAITKIKNHLTLSSTQQHSAGLFDLPNHHADYDRNFDRYHREYMQRWISRI
ncbi:hypothetical protein WDW86_14950 [Bdellovibrionota bacterium FG-2]